MALINNIIDIEYLINREGIGVTSDDEDETNLTTNQTFNLNDQISANLKQLHSLMHLIRSQIQDNDLFLYELNRIDCLNERLINLNELFEFNKENNQLDSNQTRFTNTLLVKKLNSLNTIFGLKNLQLDNELIELIDKNKRILRINSINLDDDDDETTNEVQDLMCAIYQFDNSNLLNQSVHHSHHQQHQHQRFKPKRSSSADNYNSTLKRRLRQNKIQNSNNLILDSISTDTDTTKTTEMTNSFKLNEKCISIHSFKFKSNKSNQLNELIDLKPNCSHIKIIIYKLIKLKSKLLNNQFKNPVKYVTINLTSNQPINSLYETFKFELKSFQTTNQHQRRQLSKKETASSMLKRMFAKSKQSSLNTNSELDLKNKSATISSVKSDFETSNICFDISNSESEKLLTDLDLLNVDSFESWLHVWQTNRINNKSTDSFEILSVYLNRIEHTLPDELDDPFYYYFQLRLESRNHSHDDQYINLFRSNLFKLNENINDLCRIPFDESDLSEKQLKFDLYKLEKHESNKPVTSTIVTLNRTSLTQINELNLGHVMKFSNLKVKFSFQSKYYPSRRIAIDIYEFNLDNQNASLLLQLVDVYLMNKKFNESILIRKFLEFFSILNDPNKLAYKQTRLIRDTLIAKLFESFLNLVNETNQSDLKFLILNLKQHHHKPANQFLINQIKTNESILVVNCLNKLIEIILLLSVNKSKYELKYEISDLIAKFTRLECLDSFKFVDHLVDLYTPLELADILINKLMPNLSLNIITNDLFQLKFFISNYQFRNKVVTYLIKTHVDKLKLDQLNLKLVKSIFNQKHNISKQNLDDLIKLIFKELISSLINSLKLNESQDRKQLNKDTHLKDSFVCLFEILNLIQTTKDLISNQDLNHLFEILIFYLKTKLFVDEQLQFRFNLIILKFSKFIQKHLQFYQISKQDDESLIQSYFEVLFSFLNMSNISYSLPIRLKFKMARIVHSFWSSLTSKLKRSLSLNEFLISRLCKSLLANSYFKLIEFKPVSTKPISINSRLYLNQFISSQSLNTDSCVYLFYDLCFKMLNDILVYNQFELNHLNEFVLFNMMNWILNKENNIECRLSLCSSNSSNYESGVSASNDYDFDLSFDRNLNQNKMLRNFSHQIFELFETELDSNRKSIINSMRICVDYNQLKDDYTYNEISIIENLLLTYNLIKQVDDLNIKSTNRLFTCQAYLNENRRQIKMYLLDDLYSLYKLDKNFLQMSLVRKQQAELIELNLNRKNESDLKEIFYLKSIKRFQINSLNESILPVAIATPSTSSSASASSFSSSSSSSSSISLAVHSTTQSTNTNTSSLNSDDCFHSDQNIQFEVCKQLCAYYEKIDENYSKFNRMLNAESKFIKPQCNQIEKANLQLHGNLYFRIGIFGKSFKSRSIRNKYFLYKHHSYEMLSNIQNLLITKLTYLNLTESNIVLLHHNQEPDVSIRDIKENKCYLQICAVNRLEKNKMIELLDEMNDDKETVETRNVLTSEKYLNNDFFYYFDRPFYMRSISINNNIKKANKCIDDKEMSETIENLWLERNILITDEYANKFENNLTQFEEIKSVYKILLNPIRNAINDINEKTKELKHFLIQFRSSSVQTTNCLTQIHNLQPLTMRLLGCLDARINGGLIKYVKELLNSNLFESKLFAKKKYLFDQLYSSIRDQLNVLQCGLNVHNDILKEVNVNKKHLEESDSLNELKYQKNYEHMYQLNDHLIDCFKLIDTELNQRWNSVYKEINFSFLN